VSEGSQVRVLIAEDEEHLSTILERFLTGRGYSVTVCRDGRSALRELHASPHHVALIDLALPEMDGLEVLRQLRTEVDAPEIIITTDNGTIDTAIAAIKLGAYDYIAKPYRMTEIDVVVRRAWEKRELAKANMFLRSRLPMPTAIDVRNPMMRSLVARVDELAPSSDTLVFIGEMGVGKNHLARYVHVKSGRAPDAYVEVNHREGTTDLLSVLFGRESGVGQGLYGVPRSKVSRQSAPHNGILQLAENGTVVIDVGLLSDQEQAILTSSLQAGSFTRLGGTQQYPLRARVILCVRPDEKNIEQLPGVHLTIPPLRERPEDLEVLGFQLLQSAEDGLPRRLSPEAMVPLQDYSWPGNVRELKAVLTRVAALSAQGELTAADLRMVLMWESMSTGGTGAALEDVERLYIETILRRANWHQGRAADALGISTKTLYRKMREYGFVRPRKRRLARGRSTG
jgi:two-component system response regulator AtoC